MDILYFLTIENIFYSLLGVFIGIVFGIIPGLTATLGVALFLPFTFGMPPVAAFALLLGIYCAGIYGGSIPAILIRTPGTVASSATIMDGYPMSKKGQALEALSLMTVCSFIGGVFSCLVLIFLAPRLASFALMFGPPEYFAVGLFGLSIIAALSGKNILKGVISACVGLAIATIGMDPVSGTLRFTFGIPQLLGGFDFVAALIGLFAVSEVLDKLLTRRNWEVTGNIAITGGMFKLKVLKDNLFNVLRSSVIGTFVGVIPGPGASIAAWLSYNEAKRASKHPHLFGTGVPEGVVAPETANNAVTGGSLVPTLTLGIPGDSITAVMLGALMLQGLPPGPTLFVEHSDVMNGIFVMLIMANVFMLILGLLGIRLFVNIIKTPLDVLLSTVTLLCFIGAYAINRNIADLYIMLLMGIIGFLFTKAKFPLPPILLGIILLPIIESNFRRALTMSRGSFAIFFNRPISIAFIALSVITFVHPIVSAYIKKRREKTAAS